MISAYMSKQEADWIPKISVYGMFKGYKGRYVKTLDISFGPNGCMGSIGMEIYLLKNISHYVRFFYSLDTSGDKQYFDYKVEILETSCALGGNRYWFKCPAIFNNVVCERRVGVLYLMDGIFACRHCHNLTYSSQNISGKYKSFGRIISQPEIDTLRDEIKHPYYRKQITKKLKKLILKAQKQRIIFEGHINILKQKVDRNDRKMEKILSESFKK
jgi:hypothetical protein